MAKKRASTPPLARAAEPLYREIRAVLEEARAGAYRAVNVAMVQAYWHVGRLIVEYEQGGAKRAAYGEAVLDDVSRRLTAEFDRGFDPSNLRYMRLFFQKFPNRGAVRHTLPSAGIRDALSHELKPREKRNASRSVSPTLRTEVSWTHYRLLLGVEDDRTREWYMHEAADQHWSTRQLDRQISVLYYERLLASRKKAPVRKEARDKVAAIEPEQFIRDPYVLEFLDLKDYPALRESKVEQAIIDNLQAFLLELGKGFAFVARQKRVRFEEEAFYVDLVFYNYLLKCFVLVDLKVGALTQQDIGQMDSYVRVFDAHARAPGDNPTIGLILCSKKNAAIARYSVLSEGRRLFAAKYVKVLPTEAELQREIERERRMIEGQRPRAAREKH